MIKSSFLSIKKRNETGNKILLYFDYSFIFQPNMMRYFIGTFFFITYGLFAQEHKIDSLTTLMEISHDSAKVEVLLALSEEYHYLDTEKARMFGVQALDMARLSGHQIREIKSLYQLARLASNKDAEPSSSELMEEGLEKAKLINNEFLVAEGYYFLSKYYELNGDFARALDYINRALVIYSDLNRQKEEASSYSSMGLIYNRLSNFEKSLDLYFKALQIHESINNKYGQAIVLTNIGNIYLLTSKYDEAKEYFLMALTIDKDNNDREGILSSLLNLGVVHQKISDYQTAIALFNEALLISKELNLKLDEAILMGNIGSSLCSLHRYEESLTHLFYALNIKKELKRWGSAAHTYNDLSETYLAMHNPSEAKRYALEAVKVAKNTNLDQQQEGYALLAQASYRLSELEAYDYLKLANAIKDSIFSIEANAKMDELEMRYETKQKEEEIQQLTEQAQAAEFKRKSYLAVGVISTIALLLLVNQQRLKVLKNKELSKKEQEMEVMKSQFFANISHEFRTPLTLILGPIEGMQSETDNPKLQYNLEVMKRNGNKLLKLINQLLELSKLEAGKFKLNVAEEDIVPIIRGVTMAFYSMAELREIDLQIHTELDHLNTYVDREKLEIILVNLLSNAFKFTPKSGTIKVMISTNNTNAQTHSYSITVRDTGVGISEKDLDQIFNRFYQSTNDLGHGYDGTGIGLALTKELVGLHKGTIKVDSRVGVGTGFTIELPVGKEHFKAEEILSISPLLNEGRETLIQALPEMDLPDYDVAVNMSKPIVLLVEDNSDVMQYLKDIFQDHYQVMQARDGAEGITMALEQIPDLIISDVMMPKKDGYEVSKTLKLDEKTSHIPIILLTAKASVEDRMEGLETRADDYMTKPFLPKELLLKANNLIFSRKKLRKKYKHEAVLRPSDITVNSVDRAFLEKIIKVVEENMGKDQFGVEQLGLAIGMSRSQLHRKLKALLDQAPNQFIRSFRLQRAHNLLEQNAATASEIGYQVGFGSPSYFTKCFHEQYGYTPSDIHKQENDLPSA